MEIIGSGDRLKARWKQVKRRLTGTSRTRGPDRVRRTHKGRETVRMTPAMRKALPANQPPPAQRAGRRRAQGQQTSTAARPIRCPTCGGMYGALKKQPNRPRAHKGLRTGAPCPGGGAVKGAPKRRS